MENKLFEILVKYYYRTVGLIAGYLILILIVILPINGAFKSEITLWIRLLIFCFLFILVTSIWLYLKFKLPKNNKKFGIVISIETENEKQRIRIKKDFANKIEDLIAKHNLTNLFNILIADENQTIRINKALKSFINKRNELKKENKDPDKIDFREKKIWESFDKKIKGHFVIFGEIKERLDQKNKYIIRLNPLVKHLSASEEHTNELRKDLQSNFPREIEFYEDLEVSGFKTTAERIYLSVCLVVGIAAFLSKSPYDAYKIHKDLEQQFTKLGYLQNDSEVNSLRNWISSELLVISRNEYSNRKDIEKTKWYLEESLKKNPNNYASLVFGSVISFTLDRNIKQTLEYLEKAKKFSKNDFTWMYNEAFVLMYIENFEKAYNLYEKLGSISFQFEELVAEECIVFNKSLLEDEPDKKEILFIIGYLYYIKFNNYPLALEYLEKFKIESEEEPKYKYLFDITSQLLNQVKKKMGI